MEFGLFPVASLAALNLSIGAANCVLSTSEWDFGLLVPVAAFCVLLAVCLVAAAVAWSKNAVLNAQRSRFPTLTMTLDRLQAYPLRVQHWAWRVSTVNVLLSFLAVIYVFAVRTAMEVFKCVNLLGSNVLQIDTSVSCDDASYNSKKAIGIVAVILYGVGIPALFVGVLLWNR